MRFLSLCSIALAATLLALPVVPAKAGARATPAVTVDLSAATKKTTKKTAKKKEKVEYMRAVPVK